MRPLAIWMFAEAGIACASSGAPSTYEDRTEAALFRENRALILVAGRFCWRAYLRETVHVFTIEMESIRRNEMR